jgi:hypothetical protein
MCTARSMASTARRAEHAEHTSHVHSAHPSTCSVRCATWLMLQRKSEKGETCHASRAMPLTPCGAHLLRRQLSSRCGSRRRICRSRRPLYGALCGISLDRLPGGTAISECGARRGSCCSEVRGGGDKGQ